MLKKTLKLMLAGGMALSLIPMQSIPLFASETPENLALNKTVTTSENETSYFTGAMAVDGIVNRDASTNADQSRWATNTHSDEEAQWLEVDLGEEMTFQSFVIAWERTNITNYQIQISDTGGEDGEWTTVYTKSGDDNISHENENIHLEEAVTARYVRLYVYGYDGGTLNWQSVSVYEFQVYEDEIPADNLPDENYSLEGTAEASDYEPTEGDTQAAGMAIDGDTSTRWATNVSQSEEERTLTVTLPASQRVQYFRIIWERLNIESYHIEVAADDSGNFETVYSTDTPITSVNEVISLETPVWAKQIRLVVDGYNGGDNDWPNVSVAEFESYAVEPAQISEDATAEDVASLLEAPTLSEDGSTLILPEVPDNFTVEFHADYEEVIDHDGNVFTPLTDMTITGVYKVTKDDGTEAESDEISIVVPGRYEDEGENEKPTVIPELAEWHGASGDLAITETSRIVVAEDAADIASTAAQELQSDYADETGITLEIVNGGTPQAGDFYFTLDTESMLGEEGYTMVIDDYVTIGAEEATGAYWSTRSILQILELYDNTMPKGETRDYPKYEVRGFMLDVARKPISMETLESIVKEMAYYKMNDFQVHLNDNLIFYENYGTAEEALESAYTGFRLESDIKEGGNNGLNQADLTNEDLYYTKEEFKSFIETSESIGVNIVPEIDTPGHSGALTKVRPDLMLQNVVSGTAARAGEQLDLSEELYDETFSFVTSIWDEYLTDDMFDESMTVHIGTDEYYGDTNRFRVYSNDLINYIQDTGRTVRMWGSLSQMPGDAEVASEGVQLNIWNTGYADPSDMYEEGYSLINTVDSYLYIVPDAGYYYDYLSTEYLYNNFEPNVIGGTTIPAGSEQMLGSTYAIWNDSIDTQANGISEVDIYDRFADALPTLASKNWGEADDLTYAEMEAVVEELGDAPNNNPYYEETAEDGEYMEYEFSAGSELEDSSANDRDLSNETNVTIENGELQLNGGESYVETPITKLGTGNTLEFDITLDEEPEAGSILFEADTEGNEDYAHSIHIMDDGRLGFTRELYDYYFDYTIPVGETTHITISTDGTTTTLIVDGETYAAVGTYRNRQTDGEVRVDDISNATLLLPLQRIGSKTNAIDATIDNVVVSEGAYEDPTILDSSTFTVTSDNENPLAGSEGPVELAFDGDTSTFWHSNYTPYQELPATVEIDMNAVYEIDKFDYLPRQSGTNGIITEYSLYYKLNADDEWTALVENGTWAEDSTLKSVSFDAVEARYLRFVATEGASDSGNMFASAAEFYVHQVYSASVDTDKTALNEAIASAQALESANYTSNSWSVLQSALQSAQTVADDEEATQTEIDDAASALNTAMDSLQSKASEAAMSALQDMVDQANALDSEDETLNSAITSAQALLDDPDNASATAVVTALLDLSEAMQALNNDESVDALREDVQATIDFINENILINVDNVRPGKVDALEAAVEAAQTLVDDPDATADELKAANEAMTKAAQELWEIVAKTELEALIEAADAYLDGGYTDDSIAALQEAITSAQSVADNDDATTAEVTDAITSLADAIAGLESITLDTSALEHEIELVSEMIANIDDYVSSTVEGLEDKLAQAQLTLQTATTQDEIDAAAQTLREARLNARTKADVSALEELIAQANAMDLSSYTSESVLALNRAISKGMIVIADEEATQEEVDAAAAAIDTAIASLESVSSTSTDAAQSQDAVSAESTEAADTAASGYAGAIAAWLLLAGAAAFMTRRKRI